MPDTPPEDTTRIAGTAFAVFKAGLDPVLTHEGAERDAYIMELKTVVFRYLDPLVDSSVRGMSRSNTP